MTAPPTVAVADARRAGDSSELVFAVDLPASPADCWRAVTVPEEISAWFTACERTDETIVLTFDEPGSVPYRKTVEVTGCTPGRRWSAVLHDPGQPDSGLTGELRAPLRRGSGPAQTRFTLLHERVPARLFSGYRTGWPDYLTRLWRYLHR